MIKKSGHEECCEKCIQTVHVYTIYHDGYQHGVQKLPSGKTKKYFKNKKRKTKNEKLKTKNEKLKTKKLPQKLPFH